jgi:hypothetical protein
VQLAAGHRLQFIGARQCHREEHRVLEADAGVRAGCATKLSYALHSSSPRCAQGMNAARIRDRMPGQDSIQLQQGGQRRGIFARFERPREERGLLRRLAAVTRNLRVRVAREIAAVQLADPIVGEARPDADGPGACLVADEADGEIETQTVPAVAIVGYAHGWQLP